MDIGLPSLAQPAGPFAMQLEVRPGRLSASVAG